METTPYWKKVWFIVTGRNKIATKGEIKFVLNVIRQDILCGLNTHTPYDNNSFYIWRELIGKEKANEQADQLARKLSGTMNLSTILAWKIFCNFLMFEYHADLEDVLGYGEYEIHNRRLLEQVWLFYSAERMFLLKAIRYILETGLKKNENNNDIYIDFMKTIRLSDLRNSLFKQFYYLLSEMTAQNSGGCHSLKDWANRNVQEQLEILSCIILSEEYLPFTMEEYEEMLYLFKHHNFTNDPLHYATSEFVNPDELKRVRKLEVVALVVALNPCWNNTKIWQTKADLLEASLMTVVYEDLLCVVLLSWTTLQMTLPAKIAAEKFSAHYHKYTREALKEKVFVSMYRIVTDPILMTSSLLPIIQRTFFNLVDYVFSKFDTDGSLMQHDGMVGLCIELLKNPQVAEKFVRSAGENTSIIFKILYDMFPCTFDKYSEAVLQLLQHEAIREEVAKSLGLFRHFTEETPDRYTDTVVRLMQHYRPYKCVNIKAFSEATISTKFNKMYIRYSATYTYYELAEEKLKQSIVKNYMPDDVVDVELYFQIMTKLLKFKRIACEDIKPILDSVSSVLLKVCKRPEPNFKIIATCLGLYDTVMVTHSEPIVEMLVVNKFIPLIIKYPQNVNEYFDKNLLQPSSVLSIAEQGDRIQHDILFAYFKLLKSLPKTEQNMLKIQIPNLIFLLTHIFPTHLDARYKTLEDKYETSLLCLENFLEFLTDSRSRLTKANQIAYDFCYEAAINFKPTATVLLRIFRISNLHLHTRMLREFDWDNALTYSIINCVKTCLNIFIHLFTHNVNQDIDLQEKFLFAQFFDADLEPSSVKILIDYMDHTFDPAVPKLACQLLKKIASYGTVPILAILEMNPYQIQNIFLGKLRDALEDEDLKVSILELITLGIEKQNGLTAAFFDLRHQPSTKIDRTDCDSILTFMEEYLDNIQKSSIYLNSPIQSAVLDLFHTLWMFRKDILIKQLTQADQFWSTLTDPLFRDLKLSNKTYSQVFNILTLELFRSKGQNDKINYILHRLFQKECVNVWCQRIVSSLGAISGEVYGNCLLRSWKNFMISVILTYPKCLKSGDIQALLAATCLNGLLEHFADPTDIRILTNSAELYAYLIKKWPHGYYKDHRQILRALTKIFQYLGKHYEYVSNSFKQTMIGIAMHTVKDFSSYASSSHVLFDEYLYSVGIVFEREYQKIISAEVNPANEDELFKEWQLFLIFGNNLILSNFVKTHTSWFSHLNFGHKVMISIGLLTGNPKLFEIAKMAVQCLANYAKTGMVTEFLDMNFNAFFDSVRPPKEYYCLDLATFRSVQPPHIDQWWLAYTGVLHLMTILLQQIRKFKLETFFSFVLMHEDILKSVLKLPRATAEKTALQLTLACLHFCNKLLPYKHEWKVNHAVVYFSIISTVYETINAATCIFLRPKVLTFFNIKKDDSVSLLETIPTTHLVTIMDHLMQIIALSSFCLLKSAPTIQSLICPSGKTSYINDVQIGLDFHIPQLFQEEPQTITYSTILCLLDFLCKTVTSIHTQRITSHGATRKKIEKFSGRDCLVFVCPDYAGTYTISERFKSSPSEISQLSAPWLMDLNLKKATFALESLASVIATQAFIAFNIAQLRPSVEQHFRKELCSGLMYFYEFVRKRFVDSNNQYRIFEKMVYRRTLGKPIPYAVNWAPSEKDIVFARKFAIENLSSSDDEDSESSSGIDMPKEVQPEYHHLDPSVFFARKDFASIGTGVGTSKGDAPNGTNRHRKPKEICCYGQKMLNGRMFKVALERVLLKYPKPPQIRNGDYLLCLIHWLIFFCELTH